MLACAWVSVCGRSPVRSLVYVLLVATHAGACAQCTLRGGCRSRTRRRRSPPTGGRILRAAFWMPPLYHGEGAPTPLLRVRDAWTSCPKSNATQERTHARTHASRRRVVPKVTPPRNARTHARTPAAASQLSQSATIRMVCKFVAPPPACGAATRRIQL
jgi:hypothetical protein